MYTEYSSQKRIFGLNPNLFYVYTRRTTGLVAIAINFLILFTYYFTHGSSKVSPDEATDAILALEIIQIIFAGFLVVMWFVVFLRRHLSVCWQRDVDQRIRSEGDLPPSILEKLTEGDEQKLIKEFQNSADLGLLLRRAGPDSPEFKEIAEIPELFNRIRGAYYRQNLLYICSSGTLIWHLIYLGLCIGSLFHSLVVVFTLYEIAIRSDTLINIYSSIARNKSQFGWTLFLLIIVTLFYSTLGFFVFNDLMVVNENRICDTNIECLINVLNNGLRPGGGIADLISSFHFDANHGEWFGRIIYDLTFFILIKILLLNLIFGMIIDGFGNLRDQKTSDLEDSKNICFICGIERSEYEKIGNFDDHVNVEHPIWNYVYYLTYLLEKERTHKNELTDIENKVLQYFYKSDETWVPMGKRSLAIEKADQNKQEVEGESIEAKLMKKISQQTEKIINRIRKIQNFKKEEVEMHKNTGENDLHAREPHRGMEIPDTKF